MVDISLAFESTTKGSDFLVACIEQFLANQKGAQKKAHGA
jgi:hypothetical protein